MSTPEDPNAARPPGDRPVSPHDPAPSYGQYPPQPPSYGAPGQPPPYQGGPPVGYAGDRRAPSNGLGTAALVLGVLALLGCWVPFVNVISIVLAIVGIILGVLGRRKVRRGEATNGGMAMAGIVLSVVALVLAVAISVAAGLFFSQHAEQIQNCADPSLSQQERQRCLEDQLRGG